MARRPRRTGSDRAEAVAPSVLTARPFWTPLRLGLAVACILVIHWVLAIKSLVRENPTIDEVVHLPAGVSYWQTGTFRLYHHNPPLIKLVAALPVLWLRPETGLLYQTTSWKGEPPGESDFAQGFAYLNASRYFELFTAARALMPTFSLLGGLVVFAWSRRLYGPWGGLLSLCLWSFCPNVLAHSRLVTTDMGATALGLLATYLFWRYLQRPSWRWAIAAGIGLGLAELAKFSMVLLYGLWPVLWLARTFIIPTSTKAGANEVELPESPRPSDRWRVIRSIGQGIFMVVLSVVVIDLGYGFEGVGIPLGRFEFASRALTRPIEPGAVRPHSRNPLFEIAWRGRVNRFRGRALAALPVPLPRHYLLGFDEQKLEAEGGPLGRGYPVYLDGELRRNGWWYYYILTLAYKVPEGTWALVILSWIVLAGSPLARAPWSDEITLLTVPAVVLGLMSFGTDINLGLRYILPIFPYVFISAGKLAPWASSLAGARRFAARLVIGLGLTQTTAATLWIYPDYLAYFNAVSGGPDRGVPRLIDSNLDWGQDLVKLKDWLREEAPGRRVGLAYFGQINPNIFAIRDEGFPWFVPPALPGTLVRLPNSAMVDPPATRLTPGLYAVSASLVRGLSWRLYDPSRRKWNPAWRMVRDPITGRGCFDYFRELTPTARIGHSILVYEVTKEDADRLWDRWNVPRRGGPD